MDDWREILEDRLTFDELRNLPESLPPKSGSWTRPSLGDVASALAVVAVLTRLRSIEVPGSKSRAMRIEVGTRENLMLLASGMRSRRTAPPGNGLVAVTGEEVVEVGSIELFAELGLIAADAGEDIEGTSGGAEGKPRELDGEDEYVELDRLSDLP